MRAVWEIRRTLWKADTVQFYPRPQSLSTVSPYTGTRSIYGPRVSLWLAKLTTPTLPEAASGQGGQGGWRELESIFFGAQGISGLIRVGNPLKSKPYYNTLNTGTETAFSDGTKFTDGYGFVDGLIPALAIAAEAADAEAESLVVGGLPATLSPALYRGDCFEIMPNGQRIAAGRYHMLTADGPTDANGKTRVSIVPPLRAGVAAGDTIVLINPTSVFRPQDDEQGIMQLTHAAGHAGSIGFTLIEEIEDQST